MPRTITALALGALILGGSLAAAAAQTSIPVHFQSGASSTVLNGSIIGDEYTDFVLGARGGQTMTVGLTDIASNGNGTIYFNILPPGSSGEAIYVGSMDGNSAAVTLPSDGDYTIRTYLMGNDRDTGKTVGYSLHVGIQ